MFFIPGAGIKLGTVIAGSAAAISLTAGLAVGIGLEANRQSLNNDKLSNLQNEINLAHQTKSELNIIPPDGKGFINK